MKILLGDINAKLGREDLFKPIIGNENLHQDISGDGVRIVKFATSRNLVKSMMFLQQKFLKTHGPVLMGRLATKLITY